MRDRKKWRAFIIKPSIEQPNKGSDKLEPGDVWHGLVNEKGEYLDLQRQGGRFFVVLGFFHTAKEMLVPVTRSGAVPPAK